MAELKQLSKALEQNHQNHMYVDQLVGGLRTAIDRVGGASATVGALYPGTRDSSPNAYGNGR